MEKGNFHGNFDNSRSQNASNQTQQSYIVEIVNKSTQSDSQGGQDEPHSSIQKENENLKLENDNLKRKIEQLTGENTELQLELEARKTLTDAIKDAHETAIKDRNNLMIEVQALKEHVANMQLRLDQQLTHLTHEIESEKFKLQSQSRSGYTSWTEFKSDTDADQAQSTQLKCHRAPKMCRKELKRPLTTAKFKMSSIVNNTTLKNKMDNLPVSTDNQNQKVQISTSIQEIRDKQNLQGLRDKLEKTLVFPDTSSGRPQTSEHVTPVQSAEVTKRRGNCICVEPRPNETDDMKMAGAGNEFRECECTDPCPKECDGRKKDRTNPDSTSKVEAVLNAATEEIPNIADKDGSDSVAQQIEEDIFEDAQDDIK